MGDREFPSRAKLSFLSGGSILAYVSFQLSSSVSVKPYMSTAFCWFVPTPPTHTPHRGESPCVSTVSIYILTAPRRGYAGCRRHVGAHLVSSPATLRNRIGTVETALETILETVKNFVETVLSTYEWRRIPLFVNGFYSFYLFLYSF